MNVDLEGAINQEIRVGTVEEYLMQVDQAFGRLCTNSANCELWFRGQARASYNLVPRIAPRFPGDPNNPELEIIYLSKFMSLAIPYVQNLPSFPIPNGPAAYWHWLVMMQHYGVPTRLMDWSRDALTALFFATTQNESERNNDAAVWVLDPMTLNTAFIFNPYVKPGYIPNLDEKSVDLLFGPNAPVTDNKKPAAVIGPLNNPNIVAQRGTFTVFPKVKEITPLNFFPDSANYLVKIVIAADRVNAIKEQLTHYGITRLSLFPEITEVANEIRLQVEREGQLTPTPPAQQSLPETPGGTSVGLPGQQVNPGRADALSLLRNLLLNFSRPRQG